MVMSDVPNGKAIAKCYLIDKDNKYSLNQRICALKTSEVPLFYLSQINRNDYFLKFDDGVKQTNLKKDDVLFCPIHKTSLQEQQKIADFLSLIDKRIEKQRQLVESLKKYKRGLLSAIFERKIRFKDDNGNNYLVWSTYKLDDICLYKNGEAFEQQVNNSGMYKLISLNSLDIDGNLKPAEKFVNSANWYLEENDLIMVLSDVATGEFLGLCDVIPKNNEYVLNQRMGLLRLKTEDNIKYIRYFINANQKYFKKHGQGSSQKNLSKDDILNFEIKIPSINEQNKIVTIIESINKNILLNIEKISNLEKYKTGLLQQMFI